MRNFISDKRGIFSTLFVAVTVMFVATIAWIVVIGVATDFLNMFTPFATGPMTVQLGTDVVNMGSIVIGVIDGGMVLWIIVAAFKRKGEEDPIDL